jgi:hypothetical protein
MGVAGSGVGAGAGFGTGSGAGFGVGAGGTGGGLTGVVTVGVGTVGVGTVGTRTVGTGTVGTGTVGTGTVGGGGGGGGGGVGDVGAGGTGTVGVVAVTTGVVMVMLGRPTALPVGEARAATTPDAATTKPTAIQVGLRFSMYLERNTGSGRTLVVRIVRWSRLPPNPQRSSTPRQRAAPRQTLCYSLWKLRIGSRCAVAVAARSASACALALPGAAWQTVSIWRSVSGIGSLS